MGRRKATTPQDVPVEVPFHIDMIKHADLVVQGGKVIKARHGNRKPIPDGCYRQMETITPDDQMVYVGEFGDNHRIISEHVVKAPKPKKFARTHAEVIRTAASLSSAACSIATLIAVSH